VAAFGELFDERGAELGKIELQRVAVGSQSIRIGNASGQEERVVVVGVCVRDDDVTGKRSPLSR
jgi:hypothetical protein